MSTRALQSLLGFAFVVTAWQLAVVLFAVDPLILPAPTAIFGALRHGLESGVLWPHALATLQGALGGYAIGCVIGIGLGVALAEVRTLARFVYPVVVAIQAMPVVAIAPLLIVWLGIGIGSKLFMAALVCFFPTFVNTYAGIESARPELLDLYRASGAGRWRTLLDVKLPSAATFIFTGLQIGVVLSLTGCVVAEFIAAKAGLGYFIKALSGQLDVTMMFAAVVMLAALGTCAGLALKGLQRAVVFWEGTSRS